MNDLQKQSLWAETEKKKYHKGDKILLKTVNDSVYNIHQGEMVTVKSIDDMGQLHRQTSNGHTVNICAYYGDIFTKID